MSVLKPSTRLVLKGKSRKRKRPGGKLGRDLEARAHRVRRREGRTVVRNAGKR